MKNEELIKQIEEMLRKNLILSLRLALNRKQFGDDYLINMHLENLVDALEEKYNEEL